jgi:sortase A
MRLSSFQRLLHFVFVFVVSILLLTGCGFFGSKDEPESEPETLLPAPPAMQPSTFANFDERAYIPDRIIIPSIEMDTPVVELGWSAATDPAGRVFSRWDVAAYAAGWHINSSELGHTGNVVMSGHNNVLGSVFRELDQLKQGDVATIWSGNTRYDYEIDKVVIVPDKHATSQQRRSNAEWIQEFDDDRLTLVSCWPRDDNSHRIIAVAHLVDGEGDDSVLQ